MSLTRYFLFLEGQGCRTPWLKSEEDIGTPALANPNKGKMIYPIHGCKKISNRSTGERTSRAAVSVMSSALRSSVSPLQCSPGG